LKAYDQIQESGDLKKIRSLSKLIKFNLDGYRNYDFFWEGLAPINKENVSIGGGVKP